MLADVIRAKEEERALHRQLILDKWNHPIERDTIIYFKRFNVIGGIETWIYNLSKKYDFSVLYEMEDANQIKRLEDNGIECIKDVGQVIKCNKLIITSAGDRADTSYKEKILVIHCELDENCELPKADKVYAVSKHCANQYTALTGIECGVLYNPIELEEREMPLMLGVFSRLTKEKGKNRIIQLLDRIKDRDFLMIVFTDLPFEYNDKRVIMMQPRLDITGWMKKCDYIVQLSDTEAGCLTIQEGLKMGIPCIVTKLPILEEFGIDSKVAKILDFDMSNLDVDDLWNIPKVKWEEPISKEWDLIMKKRVFREKYNKKDEVIVEDTKPLETTKKTEKKKTKKENK